MREVLTRRVREEGGGEAGPFGFPSGFINGVEFEREWTSSLAKSHVACTPIYAPFCRSALPLLRCSSPKFQRMQCLDSWRRDISLHRLTWDSKQNQVIPIRPPIHPVAAGSCSRFFFFFRVGGGGSLDYDHSWITSLNIVCLFHNSGVSFSTFFCYRGSITFLRQA